MMVHCFLSQLRSCLEKELVEQDGELNVLKIIVVIIRLNHKTYIKNQNESCIKEYIVLGEK